MGVITVDVKRFCLPHSKQVPYAVVRSHTCEYCVLTRVTVSRSRWYVGSVIVIVRHDTAGGVVYNVPR